MGTLAVGGTHIEPVDEPPVNIAVEGGFLQIHRNTVTLVTDHAEIVAGGIEDARRVADRFAAESGTWIDMAAAYERPEGSG
jgi:F0F1-type ATP synthase epsilon subunit